MKMGDGIAAAVQITDKDIEEAQAEALKRPTTFSGRRASQIKQELDAFCYLLEDQGITAYLEIGARHGDTFVHVMQTLPPGSIGVAVDLPGGAWGKSASAKSLKKAWAHLKQRGYDVHMILGDSTNPEIQEQIRKLGPFGAILIDGDHRYEGVKADWEAYKGMAPLVAFHDIAGEGQSHGVNQVEVPRLWAEIKQRDSLELVAEGSTMGIGVMLVQQAVDLEDPEQVILVKAGWTQTAGMWADPVFRSMRTKADALELIEARKVCECPEVAVMAGRQMCTFCGKGWVPEEQG